MRGLEPPLSEGSRDADKLAEVVQALIRRLDIAETAVGDSEGKIAALEAAQAPNRFIMNCASGVWHNSRDHSAGKLCYTACGWQYTGLHFVVQTKLPLSLSRKSLCGTCLPSHRLLADKV